jgi:hypothetical protein
LTKRTYTPEPWFHNLVSAGSPDRDARGVSVSARLRAITTLFIVIRIVVSALRSDIKPSEDTISEKKRVRAYRRFNLSSKKLDLRASRIGFRKLSQPKHISYGGRCDSQNNCKPSENDMMTITLCMV